MKTRHRQNWFWLRLITLIVIFTFLYQDALLAQRCLSPKSAFEDFERMFQIGPQVYLGFSKIAEEIFPQLPEGLFEEIIRIFRSINPDYEKNIRFKKDSIQRLSEDGNSFFSIDIDLIPASVTITVIFFEPSRPPLRYLKSVCKTWREEDERYTRERGFWIVSKKRLLTPSIDIVKTPRHFIRLSRWLEYIEYHGKRRLYVLWNKYIFRLWRIIPGFFNAFIMFFKMGFSRRFREDYIAKVLKPVLVKSLDDYEINIEEVKRLMGMKKNKAVSSFVFLITLIVMNEFVTAPLVGAIILASPIPIFVKIPLLLIAGGSIRAIGMLIAKWFIYPDLNIRKAVIVTLPKWIGIPWSLGYIMRSYNYNFYRVIERDRLNRFKKLVDSIEGKPVIAELSRYGSSAKCIRLLERMIEKYPDKASFYKRLIRLIKANSASLVIDFGAEKISSTLVGNNYKIRGKVLRFEVKEAYRKRDINEARTAIVEELRRAVHHAIGMADAEGLIIDDIIVTMEGLSSYKAGSIDYSSRFRILEGMGFREIVDDMVKQSGIQERRIYFINEGQAAIAGERMFGRYRGGGLFYLGLNTSLRAARIDTRRKIVSIPEFGYLYNVNVGNVKMDINHLAGRRRLVDLASRLAKLPQNRDDYLDFKERYDINGHLGLSTLRQAFKAGHPFAIKVYEVAAQIIGYAIVMALMDGTIRKTDRIVIGGDLEAYGFVDSELKELFRKNICAVVEKSHPRTAGSIVISELDNSRELKGAKYYVRTRIDKKPMVKVTSAVRGASKDIGPPLGEDVIKAAREKEPDWLEKATTVTSNVYTLGNIKISAKVFQMDDLPKGLNAWHFRDGEDLVIVTRAPPTDEIIYHEYREDYWVSIGVPYRDAHILASAEQALMFSEDGRLTAYHQSQLENVIVDEDRSYHWQVILKYLGAEILERVKEYETLLRTRACQVFLEKTVKSSNNIAGEWSKLGGVAQRIKGIDILQFAVPIGVLKSAGDFTLALKKMGLLGRGDTIFEVIIYDLENELDGDKFIKTLDLPSNIRVYGITKSQAGDIGLLKDFIRRRYPFREDRNGYLMIATDLVNSEVAEVKADSLRTNLEENVSLRVIIRPDESNVISLSNILSSWLQDLDSSIRIVLPISISPQDLKRRLEEEMESLWEFLVSA